VSDASVRITGLVPTYDNPRTVRSVVERLREHLEHVIVVDDGSGTAGRAACEALSAEGLAHVIHRTANGGKGAAVKTGLETAAELGFTHALQVDADAQHDLDDVPRFVDAAHASPHALVLGSPSYDESAPRSRRIGRLITRFWIRIASGGPVIDDAMCGFRVYPVEAALRVRARGDAMDFDPEIAVRMVWAGCPVINVPTHVRYVDGGVSHFRLFRDNLLISWLHARLTTARVFSRIFGALLRRPTLPHTVE
jgi:glycosyltransferase involved in cell wall biosynthesis